MPRTLMHVRMLICMCARTTYMYALVLTTIVLSVVLAMLTLVPLLYYNLIHPSPIDVYLIHPSPIAVYLIHVCGYPMGSHISLLILNRFRMFKYFILWSHFHPGN